VPAQAAAPPATPAAAPVRPPPMTWRIDMSVAERTFEPHQLHGNAGDTVVLTITGATEDHTFTVDSLGLDFAIPAKKTTQVSFIVPVDGEIPFYCKLHGTTASGMHGLLIFH
jgi:plastocyanin